MRRRLISLALLLLAVSASAQQSTGTLVPGRDSTAMVSAEGALRTTPGASQVQPTDAAFMSARAMAACMVKKRPGSVKAWMDAQTREVLRRTEVPLQATMVSCLSAPHADVTLSMNRETLHGLLAEAYFRQNGVLGLTAAPPSVYLSDPDFADLTPLWRIGTCLTYMQPALSAALVTVAPSTPQERAAFAALAPHIAGCVDQNAVAKLTGATLRLSLASAIYRRTLYPNRIVSSGTDRK